MKKILQHLNVTVHGRLIKKVSRWSYLDFLETNTGNLKPREKLFD
jgi:hypothetical protein